MMQKNYQCIFSARQNSIRSVSLSWKRIAAVTQADPAALSHAPLDACVSATVLTSRALESAACCDVDGGGSVRRDAAAS